MHSRFSPQPKERTAVETPPFFTRPELSALALEYLNATARAEPARLAESIPRWLKSEAAVVPLYAPDRIALRRREPEGLDLEAPVYELGTTRLALSESGAHDAGG